MIDTPAAAVAFLAGVLAPAGVPAVSGVEVFYDHERAPGQATKAAFMTLFFTGMNPTEFVITIRIFQSTDVDAGAAQAAVAQMAHDTDRIIKTTGKIWQPEWEVTFAPELNALVAAGIVQIGREDWSLG